MKRRSAISRSLGIALLAASAAQGQTIGAGARALAGADEIPVHAAMSQSSPVRATLQRGDRVTIGLVLFGDDVTWCAISRTGETRRLGYASCEFLEPDREGQPAAAPAPPPAPPRPITIRELPVPPIMVREPSPAPIVIREVLPPPPAPEPPTARAPERVPFAGQPPETGMAPAHAGVTAAIEAPPPASEPAPAPAETSPSIAEPQPEAPRVTTTVTQMSAPPAQTPAPAASPNPAADAQVEIADPVDPAATPTSIVTSQRENAQPVAKNAARAPAQPPVSDATPRPETAQPVGTSGAQAPAALAEQQVAPAPAAGIPAQLPPATPASAGAQLPAASSSVAVPQPDAAAAGRGTEFQPAPVAPEPPPATMLARANVPAPPGAREPDPAPGAQPDFLDLLLDNSGLRASISSYTRSVNLLSFLDKSRLAEIDAASLGRVVSAQFQPSAFYTSIAGQILKNYSIERLTPVAAWLRSPVTAKLAALEREALQPEARGKLVEFAASLRKAPPLESRLELIHRIYDAQRTCDIEVETTIALVHAVAMSIGPALPKEKRYSSAELDRALGAVKSRYRAIMKNARIVRYLFAFESATDEELEQHAAFLESDNGKWLVSLVDKGFYGAAEAISRGLSDEIPRNLKSGPR